MSWSLLDWKMTAFNFATCFLLLPTFKLIRLLYRKSPPEEKTLFYFLGPLYSNKSLSNCKPATPMLVKKHLGFGAIGLVFVALWFCAFANVHARYQFSWIAISYAAVPLLYVWIEANGQLIQAFFGAVVGRIPGPPHRRPLAAASITEFWGNGWNLWITDFLFAFAFWPLRKRPSVALGAAFLLSGLIHELVINLPFYLYADRCLFGSQIAYFALQGVGVLLDRKYLSPFPVLRRIFLWLVVIVPVPLIVNEALLHILHIL